MGNRDGDFSLDVVRKLADAANLVCSNPKCRAQTKGPHSTGEKAINLGVASHIHAASKGGPRYDATQSDEDRKSIHNGIWLCVTCSYLIDKDADRFPAVLLRAWKAQAELEAFEKLGKPAALFPTRPHHNIDIIIGYKTRKQSTDVHECDLLVTIKNGGRSRINDWYYEIEFPTPMLEPLPAHATLSDVVESRSDETTTLLRGTDLFPLHPGDPAEVSYRYAVDEALFEQDNESGAAFFDQPVKVRVYIDGTEVASAEKPFRELQNF